MKFLAGLEQSEEQGWRAWVLDLPGCAATGRSEESALTAATTAIEQYDSWRRANGFAADPPISSPDITFELAGYGDFFRNDETPLSQAEAEHAAWLLGHAHDDLQTLLDRIGPQALAAPLPGADGGEFGDMRGILRHIAVAEWWYLDRLGLAFDRTDLPETSPLEALAMVRQHTARTLPKLVGDARVIQRGEEFWSGRKIVRRAIWHAQDHTQHIAKLAHETSGKQ